MKWRAFFLVLFSLAILIEQACADSKSELIGLGVRPEVSDYLSRKVIAVNNSQTTNIPIPNSKTFSVGKTAKTQLKVIPNGTDTTTMVFGDGTATRGHLDIRGATTDGADDGYIIIGPGGGNNLERGSTVVLYANETTGGNEGDLKLDCGNVANSVVEIITPQTVGDSGSYKVRWYWQHGTGNFFNDATNGGDIDFQKSGTTIAVDSGTAASACKGTGTFNGTTGVTVSTTCALTGSIILIQPTSDPTGSTAAYCWVTNIINATSFFVDCDQANDGTFSWLIVKEG